MFSSALQNSSQFVFMVFFWYPITELLKTLLGSDALEKLLILPITSLFNGGEWPSELRHCDQN